MVIYNRAIEIFRWKFVAIFERDKFSAKKKFPSLPLLGPTSSFLLLFWPLYKSTEQVSDILKNRTGAKTKWNTRPELEPEFHIFIL